MPARGAQPDLQAGAGGKGFEAALALQLQGPEFKSQQLTRLSCDPEYQGTKPSGP